MRESENMKNRLSATEAARNFSEILNRIRYRGEEFVIERGGEAVCRMLPARPYRITLAELADLLEAIEKPDAAYWRSVERAIRKQPMLPKTPWQS